MKVKTAEVIGVQPVYSTNVDDNLNYVTDGDIINKNCLIDEDYTGIWHLDVHNVSRNPAVIKAGDKLAQFVMYKVEYPAVEVVQSEDELFKEKESERGSGWAGSTGVR